MNILVISQYYYPEDFRINDICEEFVRRGHQVTVVTGMPNYPEGVVYKGYENSYRSPEIINGVKVIRCHNRPRKKGTLNLLLNYVTYYKKATKLVNKMKEEFDIVYAYQMSPVMQVLPAIAYKKKHNVPLFIYVCDLWPESMRDLGSKKISQKSLIYKHYLKLSKKIYNSADIIGTKCEEFIDYLSSVCGVDKNKCSVIYEHAESNYLQVQEKPIDNGIVDFMFLGNIGHASNCDLIIKATSMLVGDNFRIHFVGDGSELNNIKSLAKQLNVESKVLFHGRHPQTKIIDFYNLCDVCLLTLSNESVIGLTPPAKLMGYMAANRLIVASINGSGEKIINNSNCGLVCQAGDSNGLARLMQQAIDNYSVLSKLGANGRKYFLEHFTLKQHVDDLEEMFAI